MLDADDTFINQKGGVFETKLTSDFGPGNDLFVNEEGGTVLAATDPKVKETSGIEGLEHFENKGLITLQDGRGRCVLHRQQLRHDPARVQRLRQVDLGRRCLSRGTRVYRGQFIIDGNVRGRPRST